jgi:hypothetical protein
MGPPPQRLQVVAVVGEKAFQCVLDRSPGRVFRSSLCVSLCCNDGRATTYISILVVLNGQCLGGSSRGCNRVSGRGLCQALWGSGGIVETDPNAFTLRPDAVPPVERNGPGSISSRLKGTGRLYLAQRLEDAGPKTIDHLTRRSRHSAPFDPLPDRCQNFRG